MNYHIHTTRDLSPQELINVIGELDLERLGLMELKMIEPREGQQPHSYFYLDAIRRKLYDFYVVRKEVPTLKSLLRALKKELKFNGSTKSLRKLLRKDGFHIAHRHKKGRKHRSKKQKQCRCRSSKHSNAEMEEQ